MAIAPNLPQPTRVPISDVNTRSFITPMADFLLLGGGSLVVLLLVMAAFPTADNTIRLAEWMLLTANVVNHPHFAYSYQLFYRNFRARAFGDAFPHGLKSRYRFAALYAPVLLAAFLGTAVARRDMMMLGLGANLMGLLVGWHYVKQGYGMLIVDGVLKRNFFDARDKRWLLWNGYAVWALSWCQINRIFEKGDYWGVAVYTIGIPNWVFYLSVSAAVSTSVMAAKALFRLRGGDAPFPINGAVAYVVSLYVWLLVRHPAALLVIPALHSLQYLVVVFRYRINLERNGDTLGRRWLPSTGAWSSLLLFAVAGAILGYLAFWIIPLTLDSHFTLKQHGLGPAPYLFSFWVFINVHHYLLDNVIWRKDNPDTSRYLFNR